MKSRISLSSLPVIGIVLLLLVQSGCHSSGGNKPVNPFAMDRQIVPPPSTFSSQGIYVGQQPGGGYSPQGPATTYPSGTTPTTTPPLGGGYGSGGSTGGASVYQQSAATPASPAPATVGSVGSAGWVPDQTLSGSAQGGELRMGQSTGETVFQNAETRSHVAVVRSSDGRAESLLTDPDLLAVSSTQMMTRIVDDRVAEAVVAEPVTTYAGQYQP